MLISRFFFCLAVRFNYHQLHYNWVVRKNLKYFEGVLISIRAFNFNIFITIIDFFFTLGNWWWYDRITATENQLPDLI